MSVDYEAEYNNRARVPEHAEIFARWQREAAAYRASAHNAKLGLSYGPSIRRTIDVFPARHDDQAPLAMFIHERHNYRNSGGSALRRAGCRDCTDHDYARTVVSQLAGKRGETLVMPLRPA